MKQHIISILAVTVLTTALPAWADARRDGRHDGRPDVRHDVRHDKRHDARGWVGNRDIRHFHNHHIDVWRGGKWHHGRHDGRLGWWWVAAGMWYFYPKPVYPYPDPYVPPVVVVQPAPEPAPQPTTAVIQPQAQNWYYCEANKSYYPYVKDCPAGWKAVPATPPGAPDK